MAFQIQWLRRFIRRHTKPIPEHSASIWKNRLSLAYVLLAWNAFGVVCYACIQGKHDWADYHGLEKDKGTPAQQWSKTLGIKNATVYRVSGFDVQKYEVHNEFEEDPSIWKKNNRKVVEAVE